MARRGRRRLMLIAGGAGFLGRHLIGGRASDGWEIVAPSSSSMDIRRRKSTIAAITDWKPTAVVNLAVRSGDRRTNVGGARHIAEAAAACGARLVHLSTDVVFPSRLAPFTERDEPAPVTDYGREKRDAERAVLETCPGAVVIRTSLLYGTDRLAPIQLDVGRALSIGPDHRPMTFFTDEFRCPAHAADVADAVATLAGRTDVAGPLHVAGPDPVSRADFARTVAAWLGLDGTRLVTSTVAASGLARPARVVLDVAKADSLGISCRPLATTLHP